MIEVNRVRIISIESSQCDYCGKIHPPDTEITRVVLSNGEPDEPMTVTYISKKGEEGVKFSISRRGVYMVKNYCIGHWEPKYQPVL